MPVPPYNTSIYNHLYYGFSIINHPVFGIPHLKKPSMTSQCPRSFSPGGEPWRSMSLTSARGSFFLLPRYGTRGPIPRSPTHERKPETRVGEKDMLP